MTERKPFSIEQSEELIAQLKTDTPSEFEQLRKTLQLLGQIPELSQGMVPPALPSTVNQAVVSFARKSSKSHRPIITSIIAAGILASASLTAAAVTGRGPAPIVAVAHNTSKFVKHVVGTVTSVVTGTNSGKGQDSNNETSQLVPTVAPTPSGENNSENNQTSENNNSEATGAPVIVQPESSTKEQSRSENTKPGKDPSESPKPETTPTPAGEVVLQKDIPTPAPEISKPLVESETEGSD